MIDQPVGRFVTAVGALLLPAASLAGTLDLEWDPTPGATGYHLHYGSSSGTYASVRDVGNVTETTVTGLPDCAATYFALSAYNAFGESGYSNEVSTLPQPTITGTAPGAAMQGEQLAVRLTGTNFDSGAAVTLDNPNVILTGVKTVSCNQIEMVATVEPTARGVRPAQIGKFSIGVQNPSGASDRMAQAFEVLVNPARFELDSRFPCTDHWLDGWDTNALAVPFGSPESDSRYSPDMDFDGDGWIDGQDLALFSVALGEFWSGTAWVRKTPVPVCDF